MNMYDLLVVYCIVLSIIVRMYIMCMFAYISIIVVRISLITYVCIMNIYVFHCRKLQLPMAHLYGRIPKFHSVFFGRDPGTLKSDIVSKKHPQLICSDSRLSN